MTAGKKEDRIQNFLCEAVLHIINLASIRDVQKRVDEKYKDDEDVRKEIVINEEPFRANINIDSGVAYDEDRF